MQIQISFKIFQHALTIYKMRIFVCLVNLLIVRARPRNGQWGQGSSTDGSDVSAELNCDTYISKSFDQGKLWEVVVGLLAKIERKVLRNSLFADRSRFYTAKHGQK